MRFLLHPRVTAVAKRLAKKGAGTAPVTATVGAFVSGDTADASTDTHRVNKTWAQQCSPDCGCVVRLEAVVCDETVQQATFTAKQLVTSKHGGRLEPILTRKGRPMLQACTCPTLHHLAEAVVSYLPGQNWQRVKNMLEFDSTRSSAAFGRTVLSAQQLPITDTHCFDVVEEATTALFKGYLPKQRRRTIHVPQEESVPAERRPEDWPLHVDDDEEHVTTLPFGSLFRDTTAQYKVDPPKAMSTLNMFDLNISEAERLNSTRRRKNGSLLTDWVSYVDEMYQEEEGEEQRSA